MFCIKAPLYPKQVRVLKTTLNARLKKIAA
jgi:hypothetical protein